MLPIYLFIGDFSLDFREKNQSCCCCIWCPALIGSPLHATGQEENLLHGGHRRPETIIRSKNSQNRLRTSQNLATELDLAIVAKRSFKNCVYCIYISLKKDSLKKLQIND